MLARTGQEALDALAAKAPALLLLDYSLPDMTASALLTRAREQGSSLPPFVVVTGAGDERIAVEMMKNGARDYLIKDRHFLDSLATVVVRVLRESQTERKLAEAQGALARTQSFLVAALDQTPAGIIVLDAPDARARLTNKVAEELLRVSHAQMAEVALLTVSDDSLPWRFYRGDGTLWPIREAPFARAIRDGVASHNEEVRIEFQDGTERWVLVNCAPIRDESGQVVAAIAVFPDITEHKRGEDSRRRLQTQLQQAQKLESLGVLAGGIAHDFNNLLMAILGNADLATRAVPGVSPIRTNLDEIIKASRRASELCRQMLAYSGKGRFEMKPIDLSQVVSEMIQMLEVSVSRKASLYYDLGSSMPMVEADPMQIRQVIMNLVTNASEALGDGPGSITVSTGIRECDAPYLKNPYLENEAPAGVYAYLDVADNGCGMDADTLAKIFDPFFTTKFTGRGLGMPAVLGIIRGHNGALKIQSEPGKGTTVRMLLPAIASQVEDPLPTPEPPQESPKQNAILLIDDEDFVRDVGARMLEWMGFDVLLAEDGIQGIELFKQHQNRIACILLDLTMPRMDGEECLQELRRIQDDVRVVLSSGYDESDIARRFAGRGLAAFIQKPYQTDLLRDVLQEVLKRTLS